MAQTAGNTALKVLIADDDPGVLKLLAARCAKMGLDVQTTGNGINALMMARRTSPDVLIIDVNMPALDGLSVCFRVLSQETKRIEVIVITGNPDPEIKERCESYGAVYGRKGPDLWNVIQTAVVETFPDADLDIDAAVQARPITAVPDRPRVLIVDDDPDVAQYFGSRLRKIGLDVLSAPNGVQGYRIAQREMPSVIISDVIMPEGDIRYLLWKLRANPATQNIPVFIVSARPFDTSAQADLRREVCGHAGAAQLFQKSSDMSALIAALQEHCSLSWRGGESAAAALS